MKLVLREKHSETSDVVSFQFTTEHPEKWVAGQYMTWVVPHENPDSHGKEHFFTISAAPCEGHYQVTTRLTGSTFKDALNAKEIGDSIEAKRIEGDFTLEHPDKRYVFVAGGIGITPFRSMLKQFDHDGKKPHIHLLYGNRTEDIVFKEELEDFATRNPHLQIDYVIEPERLDADTIRRLVPDLFTPIFYISGPEPMVEALEKVFWDELGVPEGRTKRDYFPGYDESNF
jgi:ferredoxin-NADP reductase